ncbi:hypothetical protein FD09_GL000808 [Schleiferilactobacillus perolens DSM 12744]|uniref:Type I restriction modification DNA specificity domain-containing protein n=1 Tax=Schleiferilactobacillus perolens DSM 12744 TaxID=1423792 RepID=A0A0R1MU62_9LACO|nr:hypothetical protein FD09_GL000808 [Schleiferilactobacillus perolens DSM 12744]
MIQESAPFKSPRPIRSFFRKTWSIRPKKNRVDGRWLYQYLLSPFGEAQIANTVLGSSTALIPIKRLQEIPVVTTMSLPEQQQTITDYERDRQAIAAQISALNKKLAELDKTLYRNIGITGLYKEKH